MANTSISINGFSPALNRVLNKALEHANSTRNKFLGIEHIIIQILRYDRDICGQFESEFGVGSSIKLAEALQAKLDEQAVDGNVYVTINDRTQYVDTIFRELLTNAPGLAENKDLYDIVINDKDGVIIETMIEIGICSKDIAASINYIAKTKFLQKVAFDMNCHDNKDAFDPMTSRDDIIEKVIEILGRRQKCNPCIIGEPGVGKTTIVEGLVRRINEGNVPEYLRDVHIVNVDISALTSGCSLRGDFEARMNSILYEGERKDKIILFFDEMHMIMDAGSAGGNSTMTSANILKPAISKGTVQIIGATTSAEYKRFVEKDKAFERRLEPVVVGEPSVEQAIKMVEKVAEVYRNFHNATFDHGVIEAAVKLSDRFITDRKLPDKAITVLDSASAKVKKYVVEGAAINITVSDIIETVSNITGIDINELDDEGKAGLRDLGDKLRRHVVGQDEAIDTVTKAIRRSKVGINDPDKPIGTFLFVGPTGVGKTELVKALAIEFSHGIKNMIRFDMSEFMEKHSVSKLIGAPPGYVGFGDGGQLTEAVKRNPYSIILFDEIEKAHPDVFNIMLQILDDGQLTDSEGDKVNFRNTIIIMTSNAGYKSKTSNTVGFGNTSSTKSDRTSDQEVMKALEKTFRPEFLNRIDKVVLFNELDEERCTSIVRLLVNKTAERLSEKAITLTWDTDVEKMILAKGYDKRYGARNLKRAIQENIEDFLADSIINGDINTGDTVKLVMKEDKIHFEKSINLNKESDTIGECAEAQSVSVWGK